jgi:tRNA 2-thiouridine synthesizing protein A
MGCYRPLMLPTANEELDARGLICPEPLMLARNRLRAMAKGEVLLIRATDPSTVRDFTNLCRFMGHELMDHRQEDGEYLFRIKRG